MTVGMRMSSLPARFRAAFAVVLLSAVLGACGVSDVPALEEQATSAWSEVRNQYQRRADLVPTLLETMKGVAEQEREALTQVAEARARASEVPVDAATVRDPQRFQAFQQAQDRLSGALSRLLASVERYPDLKSNADFLALQSQIEGTENRIAVARRDYVEAVRGYNAELSTIPSRWIAAFLHPDAKPMLTFSAPAGQERPPGATF